MFKDNLLQNEIKLGDEGEKFKGVLFYNIQTTFFKAEYYLEICFFANL